MVLPGTGSNAPAKKNNTVAKASSDVAAINAQRKIKSAKGKNNVTVPTVTKINVSKINTSGNPNIGKGATPDQVNPPFDSSMTTIGSGHANGFKNPQRGYFLVPEKYGKQVVKGGKSGNKTKQVVQSGINTGPSGRVKFLWNPPELIVDYPQNPLVPAANARNPALDLSNDSLIAPYGSLSVPVYFDRTIDVMTGAVPNGVWADILAFYDLCGISIGTTSKTTNGTQKTSYVGYSYAVSPLGWVEGWLYLGAQTQYYGVLTDLNVDVTQWNADMVPVRVTITLSMTLLTPPKNTPGASTTQTLATSVVSVSGAANATALVKNKGTNLVQQIEQGMDSVLGPNFG